MTGLSGMPRGRVRLVSAAGAVVMTVAGVGAGEAVAAGRVASSPAAAPVHGPVAAADGTSVARAGSLAAPVNPLRAVDRVGDLYRYRLSGGGLNPRERDGVGWDVVRLATQADHDADGSPDGVWTLNGTGNVYYAPITRVGEQTPGSMRVGSGWGIYDMFVSPGNLGGAAADDLITRDGAGVLWMYLGYGDGRVTARVKIGGGWQVYDQITGKGDLTGDGRADIVARDSNGVLYLYKGTGNYKAPFAPRTRIGAGWNQFNNLVSIGDIDFDGRTDLLARSTGGALFLYKGTGSATTPFKPKTIVGTGGWNTYRIMF
ncbi:FG-GAP repeat domain-containing protein [Streptomyces cinereoruber]|uniref:FG-GAP repeat domain-containing protein n=1 Tax=Streptomyces cinereoruber TaxID=67260 RepID=UPI00364140FC